MQGLLETVNKYTSRGEPSSLLGKTVPRKAARQFVGSLIFGGRLNSFCASLVAQFMVSNEVLVVVSRDAIQSISCDGYILEERSSAPGPNSGEISGVAAHGSSTAISYNVGVARYSSRFQLEKDIAFGGYSNNILSIAVTPDGVCMATGGGNGIVTVWSRDMNPLHYLSGHTDWVRFVKFTKAQYCHLHLFSAGDDGLVILWDPLGGTMLSRLDCLQGQGVHAFEASWRSGLVAIACDSPTIALYKPHEDGEKSRGAGRNVRLEQKGQITDVHRSVPTAVRFSEDSQWVISAGEDETLAVTSIHEPRRNFICCEFITRRHCMTFMNTFTSLCILASPPESSAIIVAACATDGTVVQWVVNPITLRFTYTKKFQLHLGALVAMDVLRDVAEC